MENIYDVPYRKRIRIIIDSDAKNEADDQYAIVQALLTPQFEVKGIIGAHFKNNIRLRLKMIPDNTVDQSCNEIHKLLDLMNLSGKYPILRGAEEGLDNEDTPQLSEGSDFIIEEAMKDNPLPLYVIFLGGLTDLASAILKEPDICNKMTVIWIGGGIYPDGGSEANLNRDIHAANVVFGSSVPFWQVPLDAYREMRVTIAELAYRVRPCGEIGRYLYQQLIDFNNEMGHVPVWPKGESWILGDSPAVGLLMDDLEGHYEMRAAPRVNLDGTYISSESDRLIRVYHSIDARYILEDLFAKLALHYYEHEGK